MAVREIRLFGDPVLRSACDLARPGDARVASLVADLLETVRVPGRAGLAANQIGVLTRAFSYNVEDSVGYILNPRVTRLEGGIETVDEGCLSVPGFYFPRERYPFAEVIGNDLDGHEVVLSGTGLMAQALQHETDHLDGHLFIEGLQPEAKRDAMRLLRAAAWF